MTPASFIKFLPACQGTEVIIEGLEGYATLPLSLCEIIEEPLVFSSMVSSWMTLNVKAGLTGLQETAFVWSRCSLALCKSFWRFSSGTVLLLKCFKPEWYLAKIRLKQSPCISLSQLGCLMGFSTLKADNSSLPWRAWVYIQTKKLSKVRGAWQPKVSDQEHASWHSLELY